MSTGELANLLARNTKQHFYKFCYNRISGLNLHRITVNTLASSSAACVLPIAVAALCFFSRHFWGITSLRASRALVPLSLADAAEPTPLRHPLVRSFVSTVRRPPCLSLLTGRRQLDKRIVVPRNLVFLIFNALNLTSSPFR